MVNILRFLTPKSDVAYVEIDDTARQGFEKMHYHHHSDIPVLDADGHYVGTLSESDIFSVMMRENRFEPEYLENFRVRSIMKKPYDTPVSNRAPIRVLLERVKEQKFVAVTDDRDVFIGIVTRKDVINYFINKYLPCEEQE